VKKTGDVCLDGGNYQEMAFRTPLIRQNRRCRAIGENNSSENGVFFYNRPIVEITWGMSDKFVIQDEPLRDIGDTVVSLG
jgi:hypothetical protein